VGIVCPRGDVCLAALGCVTNPCATVTCGTGRVCAVSEAGVTQCRLVGDVPVPQGGTNVLVSGNGGASGCAAVPGDGRGGAPPWPIGLLSALVMGAVLVRRRGAK
jgi:hypothetical protein